jgi:hypothetical protein
MSHPERPAIVDAHQHFWDLRGRRAGHGVELDWKGLEPLRVP